MNTEEILNRAKLMRKRIVDMTYSTGSVGAHIGGSLSLVEIMAVLYLDVLKLDKNNLKSEERDRMIFSKGHGAMALYAAMEQSGIISAEEIGKFKHNGYCLSAHPSKNSLYGIEFSSGSLGQGLSLAVGTCLALKRKKNNMSKVYVILGDGECDEGSIWESAMSAAHYHLDNLVAIIDNNKLQYDGETKNILSLEPFDLKWESFGWVVKRVDGHSIEQLRAALLESTGKPYVIIADTVKGKGVSFMEGKPSWHNGVLTEEQYRQAVREVAG